VSPEGRACRSIRTGDLLEGKYHLCYIFQDERGHCWGHASSVDLVHWRLHPPALAPNPGDVDKGIFSGNAFVSKKGEAVLLYHGVDAGNCIATSTEDDLDNWTKLPSNPIVPSPKKGDPEFGKYASWDPHGWLEGDTYYAIFGGNPATLFKSDDMVKWTFIDKFLTNDMPGIDPDEDISCPDFFQIGDKRCCCASAISAAAGIISAASRTRSLRRVPRADELARRAPASRRRVCWTARGGGSCGRGCWISLGRMRSATPAGAGR